MAREWGEEPTGEREIVRDDWIAAIISTLLTALLVGSIIRNVWNW